MATTLYRLYGADGQLLYVGIADDPLSRLKQHRKDKDWFQWVANTSFQTFETRDEALNAEAKAIRSEHPAHNIVHKARIVTSRPSPVKVPWVCMTCDKPAYPGYVQITYAEARRFQRQTEQWRDEYPTGIYEDSEFGRMGLCNMQALMAKPDPMKWEVVCKPCNEEADDESSGDAYYWFDTSRAQTMSQLTDWCAHLFGKNFLTDSTWDALMRRLSSHFRGI